jgi:DNA-binding transcriptional MerR regulator
VGGTHAAEGFPTPIAAKLTGVSMGNLDKWYRTGFLIPSVADAPSRGVSRVYGFRDLVAIRVVLELRDQGISLQSLRRVVEYLCSRKGLTSTSEALASSTLISDGEDVYEVEGDARISALRRPGQRMLLMVPLGELVTELRAKARAFNAAA